MPVRWAGGAGTRDGAGGILDLVHLTPLMERTRGRREVAIGLIDGPVVTDHPELAGANLQEIPGAAAGGCGRFRSAACLHGTFVAGILVARRESGTPAICPDCTLVLRPIFTESPAAPDAVPGATPEELADAIVDCVISGARIVNLSAALTRAGAGRGERAIEQALHLAAHRGVLVVASAGNQGVLGNTAITRHPWVIAVIACDRRGAPLPESNLGNSIGRRGLSAPGESITSLKPDGGTLSLGGTSVAAPIVTGAIALAWAEYPEATASQVRSALDLAHAGRRSGVVPALLNAWAVFESLQTLMRQRARP